MSETLVLMLGDDARWLRVEMGAVTARGDGAPPLDEMPDRVVGVVPAGDVTIAEADLPDLSLPQAAAAARLMIAESTITPADALHVAVGAPTPEGRRTIVAIDMLRLTTRLSEAAALGFDPDSVIAAPLLLGRPDAGYRKADLGPEVVVRTPGSGFADDPELTPLLVDGPATLLDRDALEAELVAAVAAPDADLRQGAFAKRSPLALDWRSIRLIGWLTLAIVAVTLLVQIAHLVRVNMAAGRIARDNMAIAGSVLPRGTAINAPLIQLNEALAALRGPGGGFLPMATDVAAVVNAVPNTSLGSMIFDGGGTLRVTVRAPAAADMAAFDARLAASGLTVAPGPLMSDQGQQVRDYTVVPK